MSRQFARSLSAPLLRLCGIVHVKCFLQFSSNSLYPIFVVVNLLPQRGALFYYSAVDQQCKVYKKLELIE